LAVAEATKKRKPLVFVLDDEPAVLELLTFILDQAGCEAKTFRDPRQALECFETAQPRPDIVATDYAMSPLNGLQVMQACRRMQPNQKVLVITGSVDRQFFDRTTTKPDGFIAKPFDAQELIDQVQRILKA
jgi:DNA-binding NtrC family response regulator